MLNILNSTEIGDVLKSMLTNCKVHTVDSIIKKAIFLSINDLLFSLYNPLNAVKMIFFYLRKHSYK